MASSLEQFCWLPGAGRRIGLALVLSTVWCCLGHSSLCAQTADTPVPANAAPGDVRPVQFGIPIAVEGIVATPVAVILMGPTVPGAAPLTDAAPWPLSSDVPVTPDAESRTVRPIWDNLAIYAGLDGSRGPEDLGVNANIGTRVAIQTAFPLLDKWGIGLQLGSSINNHEDATRFIRLAGGPGNSMQVFSTLGLFQRTDSGFNWGIAYDCLNYQGFANYTVGQWRGQLGFQYDPENELGVWGTYRDRGDTATFAGETFALRGINQVNFFWSHLWPSQAVTTFWAGLAQSHGEVILGVPGNNSINHPFVYGAKLQFPLNENFALFGEANFITPNNTGAVTAFLGIAYYPGGSAASALRNLYAPLQTLANNPNFAVDVRR